jgi:polyhydroxyalkanoate synthase
MTDVTAPSQDPPKFSPEAFALNLARAMESSGRALAAYLEPRAKSATIEKPPAEMTEVIKTFSEVANYWLSDQERATAIQQKIGKAYLDLWGTAARRLTGEKVEPLIEAPSRDKRFADPEWKSNQFFDFLMQLYLLSTKLAHELVDHAETLDAHTRKKATFYVQQISNAVSPSNFLLTNPELLRHTLATSGSNLVNGMKMLAEDIEAGRGNLRIRQSDPANLEVGINMATTPGKVSSRTR